MALIKCNTALMCYPIISGLQPKTFHRTSKSFELLLHVRNRPSFNFIDTLQFINKHKYHALDRSRGKFSNSFNSLDSIKQEAAA